MEKNVKKKLFEDVKPVGIDPDLKWTPQMHALMDKKDELAREKYPSLLKLAEELSKLD